MYELEELFTLGLKVKFQLSVSSSSSCFGFIFFCLFKKIFNKLPNLT